MLGGRAQAANRPRIAALDWVGAQNLLALGLTPLAMPETELYRRLAVEPAAPLVMRELGLRSEPNLELLDRLKPDLMVMSLEMEPFRERLQPIAPILSFETQDFTGADQLAKGRERLERLASDLGLDRAFDAFIQSFDDGISQARSRLLAYDGKPLFVASILDGRRMLVYGKNSLFQGVLDLLGIRNAWDGSTSSYGYAAVSVDRLSDRPDARLLAIGNGRPGVIQTMLAAPVIASLPFVRDGSVAVIESVLAYGGLPPARRFARLASSVLAAGNQR